MRAFLGMSSVVVCLGLGGCGGCNDDNGVGHLPDAPPPPPDVLPDMVLSPVTITVTGFGDPLMGVTVYFQESDSTLVGVAQTDADGKAGAVLHAGGFVTAVQVTLLQTIRQGSANEELPQGPDSQLHTFAGVKPGDDLHLDLHPVTPETADIAFDLTVPDEQLERTYTLYSSCGTQDLQPTPQELHATPRRGLASRRGAGIGSGAATLTARVTLTGCGATADMLVVSSGSETNAASWLYKPAVAVADGVPVDLSSSAYQDGVGVTFTYNHVAPTIDSLNVQRELRSAHGALGFAMVEQTATPDRDTAIASVTQPFPGATGLLAITTTTDFPNTGNGQQTVFEWGGTGDYTLDYSAVALHGYASLPDADVGSHEIAWSEAPGGVAPDFMFGSYQLNRIGDNGDNTWTWQIVAPYTAGQAKLTYPVLPVTIYDYNPAANEKPRVHQLTTVKAPGGYDAFRAHAFSLDPSSVVTGASGRIVSEDMFQLELTAKTAAPRRALFVRPGPRKR